MGNIPVDMALLLLIEKSASNDDELSNHFDIYEICSKKTGEIALCRILYNLMPDWPSSTGSM
jgi:hypothetical protein